GSSVTSFPALNNLYFRVGKLEARLGFDTNGFGGWRYEKCNRIASSEHTGTGSQRTRLPQCSPLQQAYSLIERIGVRRTEQLLNYRRIFSPAREIGRAHV